LSSFTRASFADDTGQDAPKPPSPATQAAELRPQQVRLTVYSDAPGLLLERRANAIEGWSLTVPAPVYVYTEQWEPACVAPCTIMADAASTYRVNGDGFSASHNFTLPPGRESMRLELRGRSQFVHASGIALTVLGTVIGVLGGLSLGAAPGITDTTTEKNLRGLGYLSIGTGALMRHRHPDVARVVQLRAHRRRSLDWLDVGRCFVLTTCFTVAGTAFDLSRPASSQLGSRKSQARASARGLLQLQDEGVRGATMMSMPIEPSRPSFDELYTRIRAMPEHVTAQILEPGVITTMGRPGVPHDAAHKLCEHALSPFDKRLGGRGWWIHRELEIRFPGDLLLVPDLAGWRIDRVPEMPHENPITLLPDWVAEVLSPSTAKQDRGLKLPIYARAGVGHVWIIDPELRLLEVYETLRERPSLIATVQDEGRATLPPFDAEIGVGSWWVR
jgi:Uma2 family endonuclease